VARVCFSAGGRLAAYGHGRQVAVWDVPRGQLLAVLDAPPADTAENAALAFLGEDRLACAGETLAVVWDINNGRLRDGWERNRSRPEDDKSIAALTLWPGFPAPQVPADASVYVTSM
jgi:hypothetical protein